MLEDLWKESSLAGALEDLAEERGLQEGLQQGLQQGLRQMARVALEGRFGPLDAEVQAALNAADEATLTALVGQLSTETLAQVRARLGLR